MAIANNELSLGVVFTGRINKSLTNAINNIKKSVTTLNKGIAQQNKATKQARTNLRDLGRDMEGPGKHAMKASQGFQRFSNSLKFIAAYGAAARVIWGTVNALKAGVSSIINYDQALKNLQAITSATDVEIMSLGKTIKNVASTTKFSAVEVAEAAIILGQAGFTASEQLDALEAVANLSTGTLTSMATSADLLTTAIRAFTLDASEAGRVSDVFASAVNRSKLTVDKLRIAFNYLGPVANQVGLSLEETAAGTMLLANQGLRGSTIGTGFRRVLQQLAAPSEKLRVLIAATGRDINKLNPSAASLKDIMGELEKILGKNVSTTNRARRAFELFGLRGASVASAFAAAGTEGFVKMYEEVLRVGVASQMAEKQMEGLGVMIKNTFDKLQVLAVTLGEGGLADALRNIVIPLRAFIDLLIELAENRITRAVIAVVALTTALGALRLAFKYLIVTMAAFTTGTTIASMKEMTKQSGLLLVGLKGIGAALKNLGLFIKGHPLTMLTALILSAVVAMRSWKQSQEEEIPQMQMQILETQKMISKLEMYKQKLAETKKGTLEYQSVIRRIADDFDELRDSVDLVTGAFTDNGKAFEETISKYRRQQIGEAIALYKKSALGLDKLNEDLTKARETRARREIHLSNAEKVGKSSEVTGILKQRLSETDRRISTIEQKIAHSNGLMESAMQTLSEGAKSVSTGIHTHFDVLFKWLHEEMGYTEKTAKEFALKLQTLFNQREYREKMALGTSLSDMTGGGDGQRARIEYYEQYAEGWLDLYDRLSDARQADLLQEVDAMQKKIDAQRKLLKSNKINRAQFDAKSKEIIQRTLRQFMESETAKEKKSRETYQKLKEEHAKYYKSTEAQEEQALKNWYANQKKIIDTTAKTEEDVQKQRFLLDRIYSAKRAEIAEKHRQQRVKANLEYVEMNRKWKQEEIDAQQAEFDNWKLIQKEKVSIAYENALEGVRLNQTTIDEFQRQVDEAEAAGVISYEEAAQQRMAITDNHKQAFVDGWVEGLRRIETASEVIFMIGEQLSWQIADRATNAWWSWVEGSKNAKQAMREFAVDTLGWLSRIIMRWAILKALQGAAFGNMGVGSGTVGQQSMLSTPVLHRGIRDAMHKRLVDASMFWNAPRLHNGLGPNEYPAILDKKERVYTPEQDRARMGGVTINSNIAVNVDGAGGGGLNDDADQEKVATTLANLIDIKFNENLKRHMRPGGVLDQYVRGTA